MSHQTEGMQIFVLASPKFTFDFFSTTKKLACFLAFQRRDCFNCCCHCSIYFFYFLAQSYDIFPNRQCFYQELYHYFEFSTAFVYFATMPVREMSAKK